MCCSHVHPKDTSAYHYRHCEGWEGSSYIWFSKRGKMKRYVMNIKRKFYIIFDCILTFTLNSQLSDLHTRDSPRVNARQIFKFHEYATSKSSKFTSFLNQKAIYTRWSQHTNEFTIGHNRVSLIECMRRDFRHASRHMISCTNEALRRFHTKRFRIVIQRDIAWQISRCNESPFSRGKFDGVWEEVSLRYQFSRRTTKAAPRCALRERSVATDERTSKPT